MTRSQQPDNGQKILIKANLFYMCRRRTFRRKEAKKGATIDDEYGIAMTESKAE